MRPEGIEIDYRKQDGEPLWLVNVVYRGKNGKRERNLYVPCETLAQARENRDELMKEYACQGWLTLAAAKQATDEDAAAELVAEGATEDEARAQVAEWRKMAEAMTAGIGGA